MIPRKRLDIGWNDLLFGLGACWHGEPPAAIAPRLCQTWAPDAIALPCLSVRSGFDALLQALDFAPGTEILVSALTIRGMTDILAAHQLVPVPVDLDCDRLAVLPASLAQATTPRTRAILVAHLFGSRMPMEPIIAFAQQHHLMVIEDCAQAYAGNDYHGHPHSDVSLFSFGPIKTQTALAGGLLQFRDAKLYQAVKHQQEQWPVQPRSRFWRRICKYMLLMALSYRVPYTAFVGLCTRLGIDYDALISKSVRGFAGDVFFTRIRQQPSAPLLALLERRLRQVDEQAIAHRVHRAEHLIQLTPFLQRPGIDAAHHTHWVFPILCDRPTQLMQALRDRGFDATQGGSSLYVVEPPTHRPDLYPTEAAWMFPRLLYLPLHSGVSAQDIERLAQVLAEYSVDADSRQSVASVPD